MRLATFKHISSKNADYSAAEAYLTFEHDEFTMKPTLDESGRLIPRQDYRIHAELRRRRLCDCVSESQSPLRQKSKTGRCQKPSLYYQLRSQGCTRPRIERRSGTEHGREILQGTLSGSSSNCLYSPRRSQRQRQCSCTHRNQFSEN